MYRNIINNEYIFKHILLQAILLYFTGKVFQEGNVEEELGHPSLLIVSVGGWEHAFLEVL